MSKSNENNAHVLCIPIGTQAASITLPGTYVRKKSKIRRVTLINQAVLAADNTNYLQVQLKNGSTLLAEIDTRAANEGALAANAAKQAPETEIAVDAGSTLTIDIVKNGTGVPTLAVLLLEMYQH